MVVDIDTIKRITTVANELGVTSQAVRNAAHKGSRCKGKLFGIIYIDGMIFVREVTAWTKTLRDK